MWPPHHMMGLMLSLLGVAGTCWADVSVASITAGDGLKAHHIVRAWVDQGHVDDEPVQALPRFQNLLGVRVTLRMRGQVVGEGQATAAGTSLTHWLGQATGQAIGQVNQNLADAAFKSVLAGRANASDAMPTVAEVADQVLVDIQIAYHSQPIVLPHQAPPQAIYETFAPGYHGLFALNQDGQAGDFIWPATALAGNVSPVSQVTAALAQGGYAPATVSQAGRPGGPTLRRFDVIHVVRSTEDQQPRQLVRGNVMLPLRGLNDAEVRIMADRLALRLADQFLEQGKVRGTYHPSTNRYDPKLAPAQQVMLAVYALTRHERAETRARRTVAVPGTLMRTAALQRVQSAGAGQLSAAVGALALLTLCDAPENENIVQATTPLTQRLMAMRNDDGLYRDHEAAEAPPANLTTQSLVAAALASAYTHTQNRDAGQAAMDLLDKVWSATAKHPSIGSLYWQTLAHGRLAELMETAQDAGTMLRSRQRALGLARLADQLLEQQVVERPALGPNDVLGGFVLRSGEPGSVPNPDWHTAPVLAFLAAAARNPDFTQGREPLDWLLSCSLAGRFLEQLMMASPSCYYARSLDEARDGVRLALFDNSLSPSAQAMTLLALSELQESVIALAK